MKEKNIKILVAVLFVIAGVVVLNLVQEEVGCGFIYSLVALWLIIGFILIMRSNKKKTTEDYRTKPGEIDYYNKLKS